jgi:hypothetical protein
MMREKLHIRIRRRTVFTKLCLYDALPVSICTPVPYLPLLFQGVSASDLPTKSTSLIPTKDPEERTVKMAWSLAWLASLSHRPLQINKIKSQPQASESRQGTAVELTVQLLPPPPPHSSSNIEPGYRTLVCLQNTRLFDTGLFGTDGSGKRDLGAKSVGQK